MPKPRVFKWMQDNEMQILAFVRRWWRPLGCVGMVAGVWVNCVYVPWVTRTPVDLLGTAAVFTALVAAFAVREWGKTKGVDKDQG